MKQSSRSLFEKKLAKEHSCYILITCGKPDQEGLMQVEMSHSGDLELASYLLQGAQSVMDQNIDENEDQAFPTELRVIK